jgi:hypothetical protein
MKHAIAAKKREFVDMYWVKSLMMAVNNWKDVNKEGQKETQRWQAAFHTEGGEEEDSLAGEPGWSTFCVERRQPKDIQAKQLRWFSHV